MRSRGISRRYISHTQLDQVGVDMINSDPIFLRCQTCKQKWAPNIQPGGLLPKEYWKCPNGCNDFAFPYQARLIFAPLGECPAAT
jgi:hypothetical protein